MAPCPTSPPPHATSQPTGVRRVEARCDPGTVIVLRPVAETDDPGHRVQARARCLSCDAWCYLGPTTFPVVREGRATPICRPCAAARIASDYSRQLGCSSSIQDADDSPGEVTDEEVNAWLIRQSAERQAAILVLVGELGCSFAEAATEYTRRHKATLLASGRAAQCPRCRTVILSRDDQAEGWCFRCREQTYTPNDPEVMTHDL